MEGAYYRTKESVAEYIKLAQGVDGRQLIEGLERMLPAGSALLELGSGPGTDWKILSGTFRVMGSDNSPEFLAHLNAKYPNGEFLELDAITLATDKTFDGIYSNKVLHHLQDNELTASAQRQSEILRPGGVVCHSFWQGEGSEVFKGMFVNYHTAEGLKKTFEAYFDIISIEPYKEFEEHDSLVLIAKKK